MIIFKDYFFGLLSSYFVKNDTYKDQNDEGITQRYLRVYGTEMDEQIVPFVENILDLLDVIKAPAQYLPFLSGNLGYVPSFQQSNDIYRKLLAAAISIFKNKGNVVSYEIVFNILGYKIGILEEKPKKKVLYDTPVLYDEEPPEQYDQDCERCSYYDIAIAPLVDDPNFVVTPALQLLAVQVANFLQPINAKFRGVIALADISDPNTLLSTEDGVFITDESGNFLNPNENPVGTG